MHGGCHPGMPVAVDDVSGSGCRTKCLHRAMVLAYRDTKALADEVRKIAREKATNGYPTEGAEWDAAHPPFTFREYLVDHRATNPDELEET